MRSINEIIVHCAATPEGRDFTVADIDRWHKARGWKGIGYHYVVYRDGSVHAGRPVAQVGAHALNHNRHSIGVCYIGGVAKDGRTPKDTRTDAQKEAKEQTDVKELALAIAAHKDDVKEIAQIIADYLNKSKE